MKRLIRGSATLFALSVFLFASGAMLFYLSGSPNVLLAIEDGAFSSGFSVAVPAVANCMETSTQKTTYGCYCDQNDCKQSGGTTPCDKVGGSGKYECKKAPMTNECRCSKK